MIRRGKRPPEAELGNDRMTVKLYGGLSMGLPEAQDHSYINWVNMAVSGYEESGTSHAALTLEDAQKPKR